MRKATKINIGLEDINEFTTLFEGAKQGNGVSQFRGYLLALMVARLTT